MFPRGLVILIIIASFGLSNKLIAQQTIYDEPTVLFTKSLQGGVHIHPKGWGLNFAYGDIATVDKTIYYGIEIAGMKHPKEAKRYIFEDAKGFSYGKLNAFYLIRPTISIKKMITDKLRKNGVEVSYILGAGASFGFTKPVYLEITNPVDNFRFTLSTERYDPNLHGVNNIYGKASSFLGFGELKFWPGVHAKSSLNFELSPYQSQLKAIETGVSIDSFFEKIPLMAFEKNNQIFFNFFINLHIGRKYNRSISE